MPLAPNFTANNRCIGCTLTPGFHLAEQPDGASLGPEKGPTFGHGGRGGGPAGTLGQCHK